MCRKHTNTHTLSLCRHRHTLQHVHVHLRVRLYYGTNAARIRQGCLSQAGHVAQVHRASRPLTVLQEERAELAFESHEQGILSRLSLRRHGYKDARTHPGGYAQLPACGARLLRLSPPVSAADPGQARRGGGVQPLLGASSAPEAQCCSLAAVRRCRCCRHQQCWCRRFLCHGSGVRPHCRARPSRRSRHAATRLARRQSFQAPSGRAVRCVAWAHASACRSVWRLAGRRARARARPRQRRHLPQPQNGRRCPFAASHRAEPSTAQRRPVSVCLCVCACVCGRACVRAHRPSPSPTSRHAPPSIAVWCGVRSVFAAPLDAHGPAACGGVLAPASPPARMSVF